MGKPKLTYGEANDLLRIKGADVNAELRELGYDIQIEGGLLGSKKKEELKGKLAEIKEKRKPLFAPKAEQQKSDKSDIRERAKKFLMDNGQLESDQNIEWAIKNKYIE